MKKTFIAILVIIVLAGGGYLYYTWYKIQNMTVWSFVPSDAILVYQPKNISTLWSENQEKKIWKNLSSLPFIKDAEEQIHTIDTLLGGNGYLNNFFNQNELLLSVHVISKDELGLLIALELPENEDDKSLTKTLNHYLKTYNYSISTRQYLGHTITILNNDQSQFSYLYYQNYIIGSVTSFLVEDAIRVIDESNYLSFQEQNKSVFGLSKIENDQGNLFINSKKIASLIGVFTDPVKANLSDLDKLTHLTFLDVAINDQNIIFNGFSLNSTSKGNYLDSFDGVESSEFLMNSIVPTNTSTLYHLSFDDGEKWHKNLKNFWRKNSPKSLTNMGELENKYEFPVYKLNEFIGNELGIISLETGNNDKPDLISVLHVKDMSLALDYFNQLSDITNEEEDTYTLDYKGNNFRQISIDEVPMRFFGTMFSGFPTTYYTNLNGYILLANSEAALKNIINSVNAENTWSKSLKMNKFLDIANGESNLSLFIKTSSALSQYKNKLNSKWLSIIENNEDVLNRIDYAVVQFSNIDGKFYTNIALQHSDEITKSVNSTNTEFITQTSFPFEVTSRPFGVRNHNDKSLEFAIQDQENNFYLLSSNYDTLWSIPLESDIISEMMQVDYYKNRKLQYLFATRNGIHIIDRTGAYIPGYPISLPDNSDVTFLSLVDYDGSKNYRIIAANRDGSYFMFDKTGKNLEGWQPKELGNEPIAKPFHLRVRNSDVLVFAHQNGTINLLNRRGESKNGFPLELGKNIGESIFIEKGASLSNTFLTVISTDGELMKFGLDGKIADKNQLFRNNVNDKFKLVLSSDNRAFVILRADNNQVTVLDSEGEEKYTHNYPLNTFTAQYYNFSSSNQVLVLTDTEQEFTYFYDSDGNLISGNPINTGKQIAMLYQSATDSYKVFLTFGEQFSVLKLLKRRE